MQPSRNAMARSREAADADPRAGSAIAQSSDPQSASSPCARCAPAPRASIIVRTLSCRGRPAGIAADREDPVGAAAPACGRDE